VKLTNPDREVFPRDHITKRQVADYYAAVSGPMVKALSGRPLAFERWRTTIDGPSWYQQSLPARGVPEWLTSVTTATSTARGHARHPVVDRPEALAWLAQHTALTLHTWSSRAPELHQPDWVLVDLDPAAGQTVRQAVEVALVLGEILDRLGLSALVKTSGKRGLHVLVPLAPGHRFEQAHRLASGLAGAVMARLPRVTTVERSIARRGGRLYLDCLQNGYGKTVVAPYSLRALDGAPVSTPLRWSELVPTLDPLAFNLRTVPGRVAEVGDLWAEAFARPAQLPDERGD
jgi:bifunctional non-homologous end joining protein LigD